MFLECVLCLQFDPKTLDQQKIQLEGGDVQLQKVCIILYLHVVNVKATINLLLLVGTYFSNL